MIVECPWISVQIKVQHKSNVVSGDHQISLSQCVPPQTNNTQHDYSNKNTSLH